MRKRRTLRLSLSTLAITAALLSGAHQAQAITITGAIFFASDKFGSTGHGNSPNVGWDTLGSGEASVNKFNLYLSTLANPLSSSDF